MIHEEIKQFIPTNTPVEYIDNAAVFEVTPDKINEVIKHIVGHTTISLKLITATDERESDGCFKIWYVFGIPKKNIFLIPYIRVQEGSQFPSVSSLHNQAFAYERKIQTFFGITPKAHHDVRPLILHENWPSNVFPLRKDFKWETRPAIVHGTYDFQKVEGEGIYEIPVGPIHAGIIEPGHFRFSMAGEEIVHLEPRLGFTHKGSEKLFEILPLDQKVRLSEKISGDSSLSHSLAFCQAVEKLASITPPKRALALRVIFAECERLANHFGDIGAIMTDTGYNFGGAQCARLRETMMQIHMRLTGSRFLRGVNTIGGVTKNIDDMEREQLSADLEMLQIDFLEIIEIAQSSTSLLNRIQGTGTLTHKIAKNYGVTGVAAKAVGLSHDARTHFPYAAYNEGDIQDDMSEENGDVQARFHVRINEVSSSMEIIQRVLKNLPTGSICHSEPYKLRKNALAVSIVEGWRGEIVYFIRTDKNGAISRVAPRDPSFINWTVLGEVGVGNVIPDFPLINKSFNLSYSGNDL